MYTPTHTLRCLCPDLLPVPLHLRAGARGCVLPLQQRSALLRHHRAVRPHSMYCRLRGSLLLQAGKLGSGQKLHPHVRLRHVVLSALTACIAASLCCTFQQP